jgi:hypothetical protein
MYQLMYLLYNQAENILESFKIRKTNLDLYLLIVGDYYKNRGRKNFIPNIFVVKVVFFLLWSMILIEYVSSNLKKMTLQYC